MTSEQGEIAAGRRASHVGTWSAKLVRAPRSAAVSPARWRSLSIAGGMALALIALGVVSLLLDGWVIAEARQLPRVVISIFDEVTDFGKSGWLLFPLGLALVIIAAASPLLPASAARVAAALAARVGFLFAAIAAPGLFTLAVKTAVGRTRPYASQGAVYAFDPFAWGAQHASFPSGHSTTAFAAAIAIGAVWPRARAICWIYAFAIGASRVVVTAHFPSDVIASAIVGVVGALMVRDYFAARGLVFGMRPDGSVHAFAGPSLRHIKRAAQTMLTPNEVRKNHD